MATKVTVTQPTAPSEPTKLIKNYSVQGLFIMLEKPGGVDHVWLEPKQAIRVLESQISQQVKNLHKRRIVNISN
jgi:hypothetical protein